MPLTPNGARMVPSFVPPPYQASTKPTCFFWNHNLKKTGKAFCDQGNDCKFDHWLEDGKSIAYPPKHWQEEEIGQTCFFWDYNEITKGEASCKKGDTCTYDHFFAPGKPIANPPVGFKGDDNPATSPISASNSVSGPDMAATLKQNPAVSAPVRPVYNEFYGTDAICYQWLEGTPCDSATCKFVHGNDPGISIASKQSVAHYYQPQIAIALPEVSRSQSVVVMPLTSNFGEGEHARREQKQTECTQADSNGRPDDPNALTCYFWDLGDCSRGSSCTYYHRYLMNRGIAPDPRFWKSRKDSYPTPVIAASGADAMIENIFTDKTSQSNRSIQRIQTSEDQESQQSQIVYKVGKRQDTCAFWRQGHCKLAPTDCEFLHIDEIDIYPREEFYTPSATSKVAPKRAPYVLVDGKRKVSRPCKFWLEGGCKLSSQDCEFLHYDPVTEDGSSHDGFIISNTQNTADPTPLECRIMVDAMSRERYDVNKMFAVEPMEVSSDSAPQIPPMVTPNPFELANNNTPNQNVECNVTTTDATTDEMPGERRKISFADYQKRPTTISTSPHVKQVQLPGSRKFHIDLGGLLGQTELASVIQDIKDVDKIRFDQLCMLEHLQNLFQSNRLPILWWSHFVPLDGSEALPEILDGFHQQLHVRLSAMVSITAQCILIIYPSTNEWNFIRPMDPAAPSALKFVVLGSLPGLSKPKGFQELTHKNEDATSDLLVRKSLSRRFFGLEFKKLFQNFDANVKQRFRIFLMFPPASETERFLVAWMYECCSPQLLTIFSAQAAGTWRTFSTIHKDETNLLIVDESMVAELCSLPNLAELMKLSMFHMRSIAADGSLCPFYTAGHVNDIPQLGAIADTMLAPHGQAILLTPGLVVAEPQTTIRLIDWFFGTRVGNGKYATSTPTTYRLAVCHNFSDFVLNLAISKSDERQEFMRQQREGDAYDQELEDKGLDFATCKARFVLHERLVDLEARGVISLKSNDLSDKEYSPIVYGPESIDPNNEKELVEWFAWWAIEHLDRCRKFTVIGSNSSSVGRASRMVEIRDDDTTQQLKHMVLAINKQPSDRAEPAADQTPAADQSLWQTSPTFSPRASLTLGALDASASKTASPRENGSAPPTRQVSVAAADGSGWKPVSVPKRKIIFEPISSWYSKSRQSGTDYEHLVVASSTLGLKILGVPP